MGSPVDLTLACSTQAAGARDGCGGGASPYPGDYLESLRKAEECLQSLEEERRKVEGFKRDLPLCIQLLDDAIQASKEKVASGKRELQETRSSIDCEKEYYGNRPCTLEEFMPLNMNSMPLKRRWGVQNEDVASDGDTENTEEQQQRRSKRPAWMAEAQLWTQTSTVSSDRTKEKVAEQMDQEQSSVTSSHQQQLLLSAKERPAGAFLPFFREQPGTSPVTVSRPVPRTGSGTGLSLSFGEPVASSPPVQKPADSEAGSFEALQQTPENGNQQVISKEAAMAAGAGSSSGGGQSLRKARRCWSPELHRRFVNALHQLGGCQIATPKQIRELMKVDGLTNDEVKSHLQKYRLHTRRPSPSPQSTAGAQQPPPQLVVLGGIWVPPKYSASGAQGPTYEPQQFQCHSALPQDGGYFTCISNAASNVQVHHRQPVFEPASQAQCSPQGPLQVTSQLSGATGRSSEVYHDESGEDEEEEAKSDSTSWKTQRRSSAEPDSCSNMKAAAKEPEQQQQQESLKLNPSESVQRVQKKATTSAEETNR